MTPIPTPVEVDAMPDHVRAHVRKLIAVHMARQEATRALIRQQWDVLYKANPSAWGAAVRAEARRLAGETG